MEEGKGIRGINGNGKNTIKINLKSSLAVCQKLKQSYNVTQQVHCQGETQEN